MRLGDHRFSVVYVQSYTTSQAKLDFAIGNILLYNGCNNSSIIHWRVCMNFILRAKQVLVTLQRNILTMLIVGLLISGQCPLMSASRHADFCAPSLTDEAVCLLHAIVSGPFPTSGSLLLAYLKKTGLMGHSAHPNGTTVRSIINRHASRSLIRKLKLADQFFMHLSPMEACAPGDVSCTGARGVEASCGETRVKITADNAACVGPNASCGGDRKSCAADIGPAKDECCCVS
jgi:hypothetical protein